MTTRTAIFGVANEKGSDNEKLVELFKNRAELKKEFAQLRKEQYKLKERIKEEKGRAARTVQKLEHLEGLLLDPEWVHTVVVSYQLRALNKRCEQKLATFAEQLKQQREKRQHGKVLQAWGDKVRAEAAALEKRVGEQRMHTQMVEDQLQSARHRVNSMSGVAKLFKGRAASAELAALEAKVDQAQQEESGLLQALEEIQNREPPATEGLDLAAKRSINFTILAFAQQLYLLLSDDRLVALVKEAADKSVGAVNYGKRDDCETILRMIEERSDSIEKASDFADALQKRAKLIAEHAVFKEGEDAVPVAGTVATLFDIRSNGTVREKDANLLGEDYWGLSRVLSR